MKELIEPILHKGQKDREMILVLEKEDEKINERINLLEMAVYKIESQTGRTKFDEINDRFHEVDVKMRSQKENTEDELKNFTDKINGYVFEIDKRLIEIKNYKKQIDTNSETILNIKTHTEEAVLDIREGAEKEKEKAVKESNRVSNKF